MNTFNPDAEEDLVGAVLLDHGAARQCQSEGVAPRWFGSVNLARIYATAMECFEAGKTTDHVVVEDLLRQRGQLEDVGDKHYIISLMDTAIPTPTRTASKIEIVRRDFISRKQDELATLIQADIRIGEDPAEHIAMLHETTNSNGRSRLNTVTASDLQSMEFPPLTYVVERLLPAGLCFFAGAFKSGKSFMTLQLALAVARGDTFFGEPTTPGEVLVVAAEDNEQRLQTRLGSLCKDGWPDTLHLATSIPRLDAGGIEELERFKRDRPDLHLVVLDVWQRVRGKERSRNPYADDYHAVEGIQSFASENDVAVLVVHHHRKASDEDPFKQFSGSTGIMGGADTGWSLERERGQCDASFITTGRDILEMELALNFNEETCEWTALGPLGEYTASNERGDILGLLRESERSMSPKEIALALGKNESTTRVLLKKMLEADAIEKVGRGEYVSKETATVVDFKSP